MVKKNYILAPSVLSADFMNLEQEIKSCEPLHWIHYDVMDFHFVPNLTFGPKILKDIRNKSNIWFDIHFMVDIKDDNFEEFFKPFLAANPQMLTMHVESLKTKENILKFIKLCKDNDKVASLAINPETSVDVLKPYLDKIDNVLVMSVHPGFGGQKFMPIAVDKIKELDQLRKENNYYYSIEVDGGINEQTAKEVKAAGVDMLVAGSYFFGSDNKQKTIESLVDKDE